MNTFDVAVFVGGLLAFVLGTTLSKAAQAWVAARLGDRLPRNEGRLSLNPGRHHEPLGLILALFIVLGLRTIAWGKPVTLNPFANRLKRLGTAVVSFAGPLTYFLLALVVGLLGNLAFSPDSRADSILYRTLVAFCLYNCLFAVFNLIPIPPLDGYGIFFKGLLPSHWDVRLVWLETYGPVLLLVLSLLLPFLTGGQLNLIYFFAEPVVRILLNLIGFR